MSPDLPLSAWAAIRHAYENTDRPVEDICAGHGISSGTLRDRMRRWRWTRRRQPIPAEGPPPMRLLPALIAAPPFCGTPDGEAMRPDPQTETPAHCLTACDDPFSGDVDTQADDPAEFAQRLQVAVGRVLPAIEATVGRLSANATHPREIERAARTLTALTRTLRELNALVGEHQAEDEGPNNLDEFRADLARQIDNIIARRKRPSGAQTDVPDDVPNSDAEYSSPR